MTGTEGYHVTPESKESFPKLSKVEFLEKLARLSRIPKAMVDSITDNEFKEEGLPGDDLLIINAIETGRASNALEATLAIEKAWDYYQSIAQ